MVPLDSRKKSGRALQESRGGMGWKGWEAVGGRGQVQERREHFASWACGGAVFCFLTCEVRPYLSSAI